MLRAIVLLKEMRLVGDYGKNHAIDFEDNFLGERNVLHNLTDA